MNLGTPIPQYWSRTLEISSWNKNQRNEKVQGPYLRRDSQHVNKTWVNESRTKSLFLT